MKWIKLVLGIIGKIFKFLFSKWRKAEFERKQHDSASDAERKIRDSIDNIPDRLPPRVDDGDVVGRDDNDTFDNDDWNRK